LVGLAHLGSEKECNAVMVIKKDGVLIFIYKFNNTWMQEWVVLVVAVVVVVVLSSLSLTGMHDSVAAGHA